MSGTVQEPRPPLDVDPITREVIQNRLMTIVREMSIVLVRASYSPIIYEVKDFSCVLLRPNGDLIAQAEGLPSFLGAMPALLAPLVERYPLDSMRPGDVFLSNDPYSANGTHKNDVNVLRPVFWHDELSLFTVAKAHWSDIGGKDPGSWSPNATNTYQEGVSIPPVRLYAEGQLNQEVLDVVLANTRLRENNLGDLLAEVAACHRGDQRVQSLYDRYGRQEVERCIDSIFDDTEARIRSEIAAIPDGTYPAEDMWESDGVSDEPVRLFLQVTVKGSDVTFDFRDNEPQRAAACANIALVNLVSCCRLALKCLVVPHVSANQGLYRPMQVLTTPGTITHPLHPAPGTTWGDIGRAVIEGVFVALAPVLPDRVIADQSGYGHTTAIAGIRPDTGEPYVHLSPYAVGWGARSSKDGINALCGILNGDNDNVPCEVIEAEFPLRVERFELIQDAGGAGKFRGGLGIRTDFRVLSDGAVVSGSLDRYLYAPRGLFGGGPGMTTALILDLGGEGEANRPKAGGLPVPRGGIISHRTGGAGGYGDPRERDPARIRADVENEYVSPEAAARDYGYAPVDDASAPRLPPAPR